jgi:hypothetical protein
MNKLVFVVVACMLSASAAAALAAQKIDLTGEWVFEVQTDQGSGSPTIVLKQDGEKLTGRYKGQLGEADLTGKVSGKTLNFSFTGDLQVTTFTVTYDGEIESNSAVKGKVDLGGVASGTFTGKRVK